MAFYILDSSSSKMQATTLPFGERLKREREMRGVTLDEIAVATRISPRFLEALENERWDQLPGGVFNRGFVRSVARFLGMDEDSLVGEYALATRGATEPARWEEPVPSAWHRRAAGVALIVLLLAVVAGGWLAFYRYGHKVFGWLKSEPAALTAVAPVSSAPIQNTQNSAPTLPSTTPTDPAAPADSSTATAGNSANPQALTLRVEAGKEADINITADGATVFSGKLKPGNAQTFQAKDRFQVSAKDSSAVLLELNGQTVPPLGAPGQPGSITLTRNDLKKTPNAR